MAKKKTPNSESKKPSPRAKRVKVQEAKGSALSLEIAAPTIAPSLGQIRERAYQIFRAGANPSDPVADWFQAERELSGEARA